MDMTTQSEKDQIVRQVYYDEDGFGSVIETHLKANIILNTITGANVKEFLENKKDDKFKMIAVTILM